MGPLGPTELTLKIGPADSKIPSATKPMYNSHQNSPTANICGIESLGIVHVDMICPALRKSISAGSNKIKQT